ncbi:hypothetical protein N7486_010981 [Penicillium sp. IBT 16267x]|nr:hypothetical protein N7486_010981 [Penicillium sp. IBT 16267x]
MADPGIIDRQSPTYNRYTTDKEMKETPVSEVSPPTDVELGVSYQSESNNVWSKIRRWINHIGAEEYGVEQIPEDVRTDQNPRDMFTFFFSANCGTASIALGYLGPTLFYLGWWDSFLCCLFFNLIGAIPAAWLATFGPKLGLRTMILPRFCFGWWPAKVLVLLNCLNQIGWAMVNCIAGATIFYDVGDGKLPMAIAVLIIGLAAVIVGLFGYHLVHIYERWSWIAMLICFCILAGFGAPHFVNVPMGKGPAEISAVLSFGTTIIGYEFAWAPIAADYGVYMRSDTRPWKCFLYAFLGLFTSQFLIEALGAAIGTLVFSSNPVFTAAYNSGGLGGLIGQCFQGHGASVTGFGKFVQLILSFSTVAVIITNVYSLGLSIQMISKKLLVIPRVVWSLIGAVIFLVAAVGGRNDLEAVMSDFLNICAYWLTPFCTILMVEHFVFRRGYTTYDVSAAFDRKRLPPGIAAFSVFVIGTVLALICMSQTWWVGPIALKVGNAPYGTDISWELSLGAVTLLYIPLRYLERKYTGF